MIQVCESPEAVYVLLEILCMDRCSCLPEPQRILVLVVFMRAFRDARMLEYIKVPFYTIVPRDESVFHSVISPFI